MRVEKEYEQIFLMKIQTNIHFTINKSLTNEKNAKQPMTSTPNNNFLSSDQDINNFFGVGKN